MSRSGCLHVIFSMRCNHLCMTDSGIVHVPWHVVDWCFYVMFIYSSVSWWIWMFAVATAGPVAPLLTMHINVFLKVMDCQSNLKAFSQDLLLRGYAHGRKHKSRHELRGLRLCGCQQCDNSMKSRGCCLSSSVLLFLRNVPQLPSRQVRL